MRMSMSRRGRVARGGMAVAAACALSVGLAACGGDDGDSVARAANGAADAATTATSTAESGSASREEAALAFARCMRAEGIDFPDPQPDADGRLRFRAPSGGAGPDDPATREAFEECSGELEGAMPELTEEQRTALRDAQLAYARCMRENGVDVPDPDTDGGPGVLRRGEGEDDPDFREADETCRPVMEEALEAIGVAR